MSWLDDVLQSLQTGGTPPGFQPAPAASPFPDYKPAPMGAALWDQIAADEAAANAAADRRNLAGMTRKPIIDPGSMLSRISEPAVSLALGGGLGAPANGSAPFGAVPPSLALAKSMGEPPPQPPQEQPAPMAGPVPMPQPRPQVPTDLSSQSRPAPAPMADRAARPAPMSMTAPPEPGFIDRMQSWSPALLAAGAALQGDNSVAAAMINRRDQQEILKQGQNVTAQALLAKGAPPQEVAAAVRNPEMMKALVQRYFETKPPEKVGNKLVQRGADGKWETVFEDEDAETKKAPSGFRWKDKEKTVLEYIPQGPADPKYLRDKGEKNAAPPGYRWIDPEDPNKGLEAIKGGPGEKVDAEVAGRLGLARSFLDQLPDIRRRINAGEMDGVSGAVTGKLGMGAAGEIRRQVDSGAEALLRMLTGAGMNKEEAANYVRRYQFDPLDKRETRLSKLAQLERELNYVGDMVGRGRGGWDQIRGGLDGGKGYTAPAKPAVASGTINMGGNNIPWSVN